MKRILILCDYYLPSTKAGGGLWTVVNLVERFCDRYQFFVITRNHESRNDLEPFKSVKTGEWNQVGNASVFYSSPGALNVRNIARLVNEVSPDGVFLNSVFSKPTIMYLAARRLGYVPRIGVALATCGEVSEEVLGIKSWKKRPFLALSRLTGMYKGLTWKASSESEARDIELAIPGPSRIMVAPDLPPSSILPSFTISDKPKKVAGQVKLIFYSRITHKKNLNFLLDRLADIREGEIE